MKKNGRKDSAVTELIGTMMLLAIAVSVMSFVYITVLSNLEPTEELNCEIVGKLENGDVVFTHYGGDSLDLESIVTLDIAGQTESFSVGDHLDSSSKVDGFWNIGERLVFVNYTDLENEEINLPNVIGNIRDIISNNLVFYGTLQDGEIILNRGGLWHFDEGFGNWAYDALGNNPPGLVLGADWSSGVMNTSLDFNGLNDKVTVRDSNALDISDNITIEAWFQPTNDVLLSEIELDANFGYNPRIIHVNDAIYAVVYQGKDEGFGDGTLKTMEIDVDGDINETIIDTLIFGNGVSGELEPMIIQINTNVYGIVYKNKANEATLKTVKIFPNGTIDDTIIGTLVLDTNTPNNEPDIIHVTGDIYAVVYNDKTKSILQTVEIFPTGVINGSVDKQTFDTVSCEDPELIHVNGDIFAIAYIKNPNKVTIRTVAIQFDGTITTISANYIDELIVETDSTDDPNIIHVNGSVYAVTYSRHLENFGEIATFDIDNNGFISDTTIDAFRFEEYKCADSNIIHHGDDIYLVAYTSTTPHVGFVISLHIQADGNITETISPYYIYSEDQGYEPHIIRVNGNVYAIVYRGWSPHTGHLGTINPYESMDPSNSGVVKRGAYGIYANLTHAFGTINDQTISANISSGWNHIVLTYDGSFMRLYSNAVEIASQPYTGEINRNSNNLLFGSIFIGKIDEVAIYDGVLSPAEILTHYNDQKP